MFNSHKIICLYVIYSLSCLILSSIVAMHAFLCNFWHLFLWEFQYSNAFHSIRQQYWLMSLCRVATWKWVTFQAFPKNIMEQQNI